MNHMALFSSFSDNDKLLNQQSCLILATANSASTMGLGKDSGSPFRVRTAYVLDRIKR